MPFLMMVSIRMGASDMATLMGTQEFIEAHAGHSLSVSELATVERKGNAEAYQDNDGNWRVGVDEVEEQTFVETTGVYVYCATCRIESEINIGEFDDE